MRTVWHYCIVAVPLVFAFSTLGTITDSILTKAVPSSDTGKTHQKRSGWSFPIFEFAGYFPAHATAIEHWGTFMANAQLPSKSDLESCMQWVSAERMNGDQWG